MKRILLCAVLCLASVLAWGQSGTCGDNLTWKLVYYTNRDDCYLEINGTGEMEDYDEEEAPWFSKRLDIVSVRISDGVTHIGARAFESCMYLGGITIPETVADIGAYAFYNCQRMTSATLPDGLQSIGSYAFELCYGLQSMIIPQSVTDIGYGAFLYCSNLASVTLSEGLQSIGGSAFSGCSSLQSIIIPQSVTEIGSSAFSNCSSLASVTLSEGLQSIGSSAFAGCTDLRSITIPESVEDIGSDVFSDTGIYNRSEYWEDNTLYLNNCLVAIKGETVYVREGTRLIADNIFSYNKEVTSVIISEGSITSIGGWFFADCTSLTSVTLPKGLTIIGGHAFNGCTSLTSVALPEGLTSIGDFAFEGSGLHSVTIPGSVTSIGRLAFGDCTSLTSVTIQEGVTSVGGFGGCTRLASVTMPNSVTNIAGGAFSSCSRLTSVTIPGSVTSIGAGAFSNSGLYSVTIPDSVTSIEERTFYECGSLHSVIIPEGVTRIGQNAFYESGLRSVTIPSSVTNIELQAFLRCYSLTSVTILGSPHIGSYVFRGCINLNSFFVFGNEWPSLYDNDDSVFYEAGKSTLYTNMNTYPDNWNMWNYWGTFRLVRLHEVIEVQPYQTEYNGKEPKLSLTYQIPGYRLTPEWPTLEYHAGKHELAELKLWFAEEDSQDSVPVTCTFPTPYTYIIQKKPLTVTLEEQIRSIRYGEPVPEVGIVSYQGFIPGEDETAIITPPIVTCESGDRPHVGTHKLVLSGGEARDYEFICEPCTLVVKKVPLTVTATSYTNRYGEKVADNKISYHGFVYDEDEAVITTPPTVICESGDRPHVGTHMLTPSGGEAQDYEFVYEPGTLVVERALLAVTPNPTSVRYGEQIPTIGVTYHGFMYDEDEKVIATVPAVTCESGDRPHVGTHALIPSGGEAQDYEFEYKPGELTVEKTPLMATPKPCSMIYGDNLPQFEIAYEGFVYNEDETVLVAPPIVVCESEDRPPCRHTHAYPFGRRSARL